MVYVSPWFPIIECDTSRTIPYIHAIVLPIRALGPIESQHGLAMGPKHRRRIHVANLDPAAEHFRYDVAFDVRDLISVDDVMDELQLGPNGSLVYCMEYLLQNMDWLEENLDNYDDDECVILFVSFSDSIDITLNSDLKLVLFPFIHEHQGI